MSTSTRIAGLIEQLGRGGVDIECERCDPAALTATATDMLELARLIRDDQERRDELAERTRMRIARGAAGVKCASQEDDSEVRAIDALSNIMHWLYAEQDEDGYDADVRLSIVTHSVQSATAHFIDEVRELAR